MIIMIINVNIFLLLVVPVLSLTPAGLPPALTIINPASRPQSVFVSFMWFSQLTAIISPNVIEKLIFVTEKCCVFFQEET
jgi:hypothetical protein